MMTNRKLKYFLLFLLSIAILCILLVVIIAATMDDADYRRMLIRTVEYMTGYEVVVDGEFEFELSTEPYLAASNVRFWPRKDASPPHIDHIGRLQLQLSAKHLFARRLLIKQMLVDDANISLTVGKSLRKRSTRIRKKKDLSPILVPILENADLKNINLAISDQINGSIAKIGLRHLKVADTGESGYRNVASEGVINAQEFRIEGRLGSVEQIFNSQKPFPVLMNVKTANVDLNISGKIDDLINGEGLALQLSGEVEDLSSTLKLFRVSCSGLGRLTFATDIGGNMASPRLSDLAVSIAEESNTQATAKGSVDNIFNGDGTDVFITGSTSNSDIIQLFLPPIMADFTQLDFQSRLHKQQADYVIEDIIANGTSQQGLAMKAVGGLNFGDFKEGFLLKEIDLDLQLTSPTTGAAKRFLINWLPEIGPVNGKARLKGSTQGLSLEDLSIDINESGPLKVTSTGRIGKIPTQKGVNISELDLDISIQAEKTKLLSTALDIPIPELGLVSAHFRINYTDDRLQFNDVDVRTSNTMGMAVALSGKVGEIPITGPEPYGDVDFRIHMTAPYMGAAEPLLGARILPDIGPVTGEVQVTGTTDVLSLRNLAITAGQPGAVHVVMQGGVGKIPVSKEQNITECNINGSIYADKASDLASLLGISVPDFGPLTGTWRLVDRGGGFGADDVKLSVGKDKGLLINAEGRIASLSHEGKVAVSGVDFDLSGSVVHIDAVPVLADMGLSDLGPLKMTAKIEGEEDRFDIRHLIIYSGQGDASAILLQGDINRIVTKKKARINATLETQTRPWVERLMHRPTQKSHKLIGRLALIPESNHMRIAVVEMATKDPKPISLKANGLLKKIDGALTMDVQISVDAEEPSIFGSMFDVSLPSFGSLSADGRFNVNGKTSRFEGEVILGKTIFKTKAHRFIQNHKPQLNLTVYSPTVYLSDIGIYPQEKIEDTEKKQATQPVASQIFSKEPLAFDSLKAFNLFVKINADKIVGNNFTMNKLDFDLSLIDGWLRISPAKLRYAGGDISFESTINADASTPEITIKANAEDLDVDAFLAYAHKPLILGGQLNLTVDLQSAGNSFHDLASSLGGEFGVAIENGRIKRDIEMITADAFDVITSLPKIKDYQDLNCLVFRFTFEQGVGKSNIIFYDTPNVRTSGGGSVNLAAETVDVVLQPTPKKGLPEFSSAIYISGPLAKPSIRKMPFKEAARLAGEIFMPYVFLPARAIGYLWYLLKEDKEEKSPCLIEEAGIE